MREYETPVLSAAEVRDTVDAFSSPFDFGKLGYKSGVVSFENSHDQTIACQLQGKATKATTWQDEGSAVNVTSDGVNKIAVTTPWNILRVKYSASVAPTSGSISGWFNVGKY